MSVKKIIIIGGGLAGLVTAIHLTRRGVACQLIEKKTYPFHRVCGEYISNEVVPYLKSLDAFPEVLGPSTISQFQLTSVNGKMVSLPLKLGGFGISRYQFDSFLCQKAISQGTKVLEGTEVESMSFEDNQFIVQTTRGSFTADVAIGSFGKRSKLDIHLDRSFIRKRSPYVGVKYHVRLKDFPNELIALHNFENGYCGVSRVEGDTINLCYLTHRDNVKAHGTLPGLEEAVLFKNPFLKNIFKEAEFLFPKPETINEISFETKAPVEQHVLMAGDAAGMIAPLCGNGMAIAIHSAKILSDHVIRFNQDEHYTRDALERDYSKAWRDNFARRLWAGRQIQHLFGDSWTSNLAVNLARHGRPVANFLIGKTHGKPF